MIRRAVLFSAAALLTCAVAAPAFAHHSGTEVQASGHGVCVGLSNGNPNNLDGICVYIPTH